MRCFKQFGSAELVPPPENSTFELSLDALPHVNDVMHIHKALLPPYYRSAESEIYGFHINSDDASGDYFETVRIRIVDAKHYPTRTHIVTAEKHILQVLFYGEPPLTSM